MITVLVDQRELVIVGKQCPCVPFCCSCVDRTPQHRVLLALVVGSVHLDSRPALPWRALAVLWRKFESDYQAARPCRLHHQRGAREGERCTSQHWPNRRRRCNATEPHSTTDESSDQGLKGQMLKWISRRWHSFGRSRSPTDGLRPRSGARQAAPQLGPTVGQRSS